MWFEALQQLAERDDLVRMAKEHTFVVPRDGSEWMATGRSGGPRARGCTVDPGVRQVPRSGFMVLHHGHRRYPALASGALQRAHPSSPQRRPDFVKWAELLKRMLGMDALECSL